MSFERCFWGDWRRSACHLAPLSNTFLFESEGAWGLPQSPENRYHFIQASGAAMQKTIIILLVLPFSAHAGDSSHKITHTHFVSTKVRQHTIAMWCRAIGTVVIVVIAVMVVMQKLHKVTRLRLRLVPPRAEATQAETGFAAEWPGRPPHNPEGQPYVGVRFSFHDCLR